MHSELSTAQPFKMAIEPPCQGLNTFVGRRLITLKVLGYRFGLSLGGSAMFLTDPLQPQSPCPSRRQ